MSSNAHPIDPARTDFGAVLGRALIDANIKRNAFAASLGIYQSQVDSIIRKQYKPTQEWINDKKILETLKKLAPDIFEKYKDDFDHAIFDRAIDAISTPAEHSEIFKFIQKIVTEELEHSPDVPTIAKHLGLTKNTLNNIKPTTTTQNTLFKHDIRGRLAKAFPNTFEKYAAEYDDIQNRMKQMWNHEHHKPTGNRHERSPILSVIDAILDEEKITKKLFLSMLGYPTEFYENNNFFSRLNSKAIIDALNVRETLIYHFPDTFEKYREAFDAAYNKLEQGKVRKPIFAHRLRQEWFIRSNVSAFTNTALGFYEETIDDILPTIKENPISLRDPFFESAHIWDTIIKDEPDFTHTLGRLRGAFHIVCDVYHIDDQHPLYPAREKTEIALGLK